ncbi:MAG: hypothetical protein IJI33_00175 [Solobacterium sp.]|nr:hypothetical protein [Solobacterium sp.]
MSSTKPSGNLQIISALLAGAGAGIIMAAVMLFLMSAYGFHFHFMSAAAAGMVAVALPWCMDVLNRRGLNLYVCEGVAVLVSAAVCLLYIHAAAKDAVTADRMLNMVISLHGASLLINGTRLFFRRRREDV